MKIQALRIGSVANGIPFDKVTYRRTELPSGKMIESLGEPMYVAKAEGWHMQHALYRLNGDYNPLHIGTYFVCVKLPVVLRHSLSFFLLDFPPGRPPAGRKRITSPIETYTLQTLLWVNNLDSLASSAMVLRCTPCQHELFLQNCATTIHYPSSRCLHMSAVRLYLVVSRKAWLACDPNVELEKKKKTRIRE